MTLQYGGPDALRNFLQTKGIPPVYVIDMAGHDLLGRTVLPAAVTQVRTLLQNDELSHRR
jgi:hypothetical protein